MFRFARAHRRALLLLAVVTAVVGIGLATIVGMALAAGELPLLGSFGTKGTAGGQFEIPRGVAVDLSSGSSKGDVYVADQNNHRVEKFGAAGNFLWTAGWDVNASKIKEAEEGKSISQAEENLCTAASGDACEAASEGSEPHPIGQFKGMLGMAVDPASGDVYLQSGAYDRVEDLGSNGELIMTFGGKVNETKVKEAEDGKAVTPAEENVCTVASKDVCKAGMEGTGPGEFESWALGSSIAVGSGGTVYVGDQGRVQEFESDGSFRAELSLATLSTTGKVRSLAVEPSSGDVYLSDTAVPGVRKFEPEGGTYKASTTRFDGSSTMIRALAVDPSGDVFVLDYEGEPHVREYDSTGLLVAESSSGQISNGFVSTGIAANASGTIYVADAEANHVALFGTPPTEALPAPAIDAQFGTALGATSASLRAEIDPFFQHATWYVQYGTASVEENQTDSASLGAVMLGDEPAEVTLTGLRAGTLYHYRFVATSPSGTSVGVERAFQTLPLAIAGLPDDRVYEQVSPQNKSGNDAGTTSRTAFGKQLVRAEFMYSSARANGEGLLYWGSGSFGGAEVASGAEEYYVAKRTSEGWTNRGAVPAGYGAESDNLFAQVPEFLLPAADGSHVLFTAKGSFVANDPYTAEGLSSEGLYLAGENVFAEPLWLSEPQIKTPFPQPGELHEDMYPAGGSPDLNRVYFSYLGTLLPEDAARVPFMNRARPAFSPRGFYEWDDGVLRSAAERPAGSPNGVFDPHGAVPAAFSSASELGITHASPDLFANQVSTDGSRAFFLTPEPEYCSSHVEEWAASKHCNYEESEKEYEACKAKGCSLFETEAFKDPVELYARDNGHPVLVSVDALAGGKPAPAYRGGGERPKLVTGVTPFDASVIPGAGEAGPGLPYMFASLDGSRVFFISRDRLTADAPAPKASEEEPLGTAADAAPKLYEFDMETNTLHYLASAEKNGGSETGFAPIGAILASSSDGSRFVEVKDNAAGEAVGLLLWHDGTAKLIAEWAPEKEPGGGPDVRVAPAEMTGDGGTFVFESNARLWPVGGHLGTFNNSPAHTQVYRFDLGSDELSCVSCAPVGLVPSGDAALSNDDSHQAGGEFVRRLIGSRDMSEDGNRVFFDTPEVLAAQDTNGQRDVYEWEAGGEGSCREAGGCRFLISSGTSPGESFYLDNGANGADVFFATQASLVPGDTDGSYDVYDARVGGGFPTAPVTHGCVSGCQTPPSALTSPPSVLTAMVGPSGNTKPSIGKKTGRKARRLTCRQRAKRIKNPRKRRRALESCGAHGPNKPRHVKGGKASRRLRGAHHGNQEKAR